MPETNIKYLVLAIRNWEGCTHTYNGEQIPLKFPVNFGNNYCPVFDSEEEAKKHYPDMDIIKVNLEPEKISKELKPVEGI